MICGVTHRQSKVGINSLDFGEDLQRSVSLEYLPLELHKFSIDSIQFSVLLCALELRESIFPFLVSAWELSHLSNAQYKV